GCDAGDVACCRVTGTDTAVATAEHSAGRVDAADARLPDPVARWARHTDRASPEHAADVDPAGRFAERVRRGDRGHRAASADEDATVVATPPHAHPSRAAHRAHDPVRRAAERA